jgi:hypothetical protein
MPGKGQCSIDTDMLQLPLQAPQGRNAKEKVTESAQGYIGKDVLATPPLDKLPRRRYAATHSNNSSLSCPQLHRPASPQ